MVKFEKVTKIYGKLRAINKLSFLVNKGEFLSLVGPSGCGKTTVLRLIAGFIKPDEGNIYINNKIVNDLPVKKRNIGIVFQNYALFPNLNVYENIAFGLRAKREDPKLIDKIVRELIEMVGLLGKEKNFPKELSGGQQQRVALARSLAVKPQILLLDEPLSALDAKVRLNLRYEIKSIQRRFHITTIYVTHDQEEALSISDRVAVMRDGEIQQIGEPIDIYNSPKTKFVANFIGISNFLEGEYIGNNKVKLANKEFYIKNVACKKGKIILAIRPENIRIEKGNKFIYSQENVLKGTIKGVTFLGAIVRVLVSTEIGKEIFVDLPAGRFFCKGGEEIYLYFGPEKFICFNKN